MSAKNARTKNEYDHRVQNALGYIHDNLDKSLTLNRVASVACFSSFHFHRIFHVYVGETLNDYIKRLRLEKAANMLVQNKQWTITEIALQCGFGTSALFARAFKSHFSYSATAFRKLSFDQFSKICKEKSKMAKAILSKIKDHKSLSALDKKLEKRYRSHIRVCRKPDYEVVSLHYRGNYGPELNAVWGKLTNWATAHDLLQPSAMGIGVAYDNPSITPVNKCRYDACITIAEKSDLPLGRGFRRQCIPGGRHVMLDFDGPVFEMSEAYYFIYKIWFPDSGYQPGSGFGYQIFAVDDESNDNYVKAKLCIPIEPL